ncbi:MAG: glycosyltransferase family 4 protein [Patescibacteria group bacterium]|jgi:glycosyltransferase involved in cell wall biosynthesis
MKHIIIDARLYGPKHTGIGRYTKNLLLALSDLPDFSQYKFSLLIYPELESEIRKDLGNKFTLIPTNIRHYSLKEQLILPFILYKYHPNLVHFTHFNKPILYLKKSVVTIHDLIKHFFKGSDTTTKNPYFYWPKYFFYRLFTHLIIKTNTIIVPSNYWRDYLIKTFKLPPAQVTTTHEAVDPKFVTRNTPPETPNNYVIYTGNLYPHKNVTVILEALKKIPDLNLKIISGRNAFVDKFLKSIDRSIKPQVNLMGFVDDKEFHKVYSKALALVHPSFMEGFSLTGLEAMALKCPVISSNTSCLPEVYGNSVLYFDPANSDELVGQIKSLQNNDKLRRSLIRKGLNQLKKYSWQKTAQQTLKVYKKTLKQE